MQTLPTPTPVKKTWAEPELVIISRNDTVLVKHHPSVHEHTGHVVRKGASSYFVNPSGKGFLTATSTGVARAVVAFHSEAAS